MKNRKLYFKALKTRKVISILGLAKIIGQKTEKSKFNIISFKTRVSTLDKLDFLNPHMEKNAIKAVVLNLLCLVDDKKLKKSFIEVFGID